MFFKLGYSLFSSCSNQIVYMWYEALGIYSPPDGSSAALAPAS